MELGDQDEVSVKMDVVYRFDVIYDFYLSVY